MKIAVLEATLGIAETLEHDKAIPFNSDNVDFRDGIDQGFMMNTKKGLVVVGTDYDEQRIIVLAIKLGSTDKQVWPNYNAVADLDAIHRFMS